MTLNPLLKQQLAELGIDPSVTHTEEQWIQLLAKVSNIYTDYQSAEVELRQSEMLYEDLYNSTWRQTQELSLLVRVREALANKVSLSAVIQTVVEATADAFGYALVSVYLLHDNVLYLQHQVGYAHKIEQVPISKGIIGRVARTGKSILIEDCQNDPDFIAAIDNLVSEVCVPISNNGEIVGVLNVETQFPQKLSANDLEMMTTLSEHVGLAMERAQLYTAVQESNQKYQMVVDNIHEVIFQVNTVGEITFINKAWLGLSGYTAEFSLGKQFSHFVSPESWETLQHLQSLLITHNHHDARFQSTLIRPDGSTIPVEAHVQRLYNQDGVLIGLSGVAVDISDRLQAEQQARETQLLMRVQEAISSKLGLKDMIHGIVEVIAETYRYELVCIYLLKDDILYLQHHVGYENVIEQFPVSQGVAGRVVRTKKPILVEDPTSDPDFQFAVPGLTSEVCVPLMSNTEVTGFINVETKGEKKLGSSDLHMLVRLSEQVSIAIERAILYTALQESNQKYQMVVDNVREIIFQTDLKGNITFLNKAWERITGRAVASSMGKPFTTNVPPENIEAIRQTSLELLQSTQQYVQLETELIKADNTRIPIESQLQRIYDIEGHVIGIGGTAADITQRLQAKKQQQQLGLLVQVRAAISSQLGLKDTIRTIVEATAEVFGYDVVGVYLLRGNTLYLQHQIGYEIMYDPVEINVGVSGRVARTGIPVLVQDTHTDPDFVNAMHSPTSEVCVPLLNNGKVIGIMNVEAKGHKKLTESDLNLMIALSEHVSIAVERARLYTALVDSNQKYQMVVDSVHEVIFQLDPTGCFTFLNQSWAELSGYSIEESIGKHFSSFMHPEDVNNAEALGAQLYEGSQTNIRYKHTLVRFDNIIVPIEVHMQLVHNAEGELMGIGGTATDIRERIQAEKQSLDLMLQTRTVEMLKGFLTGVSHDLRTPLSIMNTSLYLLRRKMGESAVNDRYLEALDKQTVHMQHVVEDMLDMSKLDDQSTALNPIRMDINGLIRDLLVTLQSTAETKSQHINFTPMKTHPFIVADQFMMGKVITNMLKNAIQYTPNSGSIAIRTYNHNASTIAVEIKDSGIGIDATTLPHIFDRFYKANEARPSGQGGTGLGLSIARKIVEMHQGSINVESEVGEGSTFTITLPTEQ